MSDVLTPGYDENDAISFNEAYAKSIGWYRKLPAKSFEKYPGLSEDPVSGPDYAKKTFASSVLKFQVDHFPSEQDHDGKLGNDTWSALLETYPQTGVRKYIHNGVEVIADPSRTSAIKTWRDKGGYDLHPDGDFRKPKGGAVRKLDRIVLHWGGTSARRCWRALQNRNLSSHFGVDEVVIYQWLDLNFKAWHAGKANTGSIGIDICQQPTVSFFEHYRKRGFNDIKVVKNDSKPLRGHKEVITLHEKTAQSTRDLVVDLCELFDIPLRVPRNTDGSYCYEVINWESFRGVVGHFHSSPGKWDPAPFWSQIFDPIFE